MSSATVPESSASRTFSALSSSDAEPPFDIHNRSAALYAMRFRTAPLSPEISAAIIRLDSSFSSRHGMSDPPARPRPSDSGSIWNSSTPPSRTRTSDDLPSSGASSEPSTAWKTRARPTPNPTRAAGTLFKKDPCVTPTMRAEPGTGETSFSMTLSEVRRAISHRSPRSE